MDPRQECRRATDRIADLGQAQDRRHGGDPKREGLAKAGRRRFFVALRRAKLPRARASFSIAAGVVRELAL